MASIIKETSIGGDFPSSPPMVNQARTMRVTQTLPQEAAMLVCVPFIGFLRAVIPHLTSVIIKERRVKTRRQSPRLRQHILCVGSEGAYCPLMRGKMHYCRK
jgi:hypothetical protein